MREAAAVASPDERRGHVVKAFVVLAEGHEPSDELADEIKRFVRDRHSAYAYPRRIEFVDELPKTLTGKIRRIELREREQQRAVTRFARPAVMGVLNMTPDSFSDGGAFLDPAAAVAHARRDGGGGADLIDVGGESTRPGAEPVERGRGAAARDARGRGAGRRGRRRRSRSTPPRRPSRGPP